MRAQERSQQRRERKEEIQQHTVVSVERKTSGVKSIITNAVTMIPAKVRVAAP